MVPTAIAMADATALATAKAPRVAVRRRHDVATAFATFAGALFDSQKTWKDSAIDSRFAARGRCRGALAEATQPPSPPHTFVLCHRGL